MKVGATMNQILSSQELYNYLNDFRETIQTFDYLDLDNVVFFNLESVYVYMKYIENNPFSRQYNELQSILDHLQPYLPFLSSERARDFLIKFSTITDEQAIEQLKIEYMDKLRTDFINVVRRLNNENDWYLIVNTCEEIRSRKEEVYLH